VLKACDRPLCEAYDAALLDLDGVLYVGPDPVPRAADSVRAARAKGMRAAFVTNNASRRPGVVAAHLTSLDIPAEPADVVTSAQAAVRWLVARLPAGSPVLVLGTDGLAEEVAVGGLAPVRVADTAVAVVQGLDPATAWTDLAEASVVIRRGGLWVAGNDDSTYPSSRGPLPGNGALVAALVLATGKHPVVVGKPALDLHVASVERVGARRPLVVGDRLDTDVLGAVRAGADSLLVLTGITDREQLLAAPEGMRPSYVSSDLRGLLEPHAAPQVRGDEATCGTGRAHRCGGVVVPDDDSDDALRAACALAWGAS
jgi:glycerol 3-phosphatase-2